MLCKPTMNYGAACEADSPLKLQQLRAAPCKSQTPTGFQRAPSPLPPGTQQKACRGQDHKHPERKPNERTGPSLAADPALPDGTGAPPTSHPPIGTGCVHSTQELELPLPPLLPPVKQGIPLKGHVAAFPGSPPPPQKKRASGGMNAATLKALLPCLPIHPCHKSRARPPSLPRPSPRCQGKQVHGSKGDGSSSAQANPSGQGPDGQTHRQFSQQAMSTVRT